MEKNDENVQLLNIDLDLPDDSDDIKHAEDVFNSLRKEFDYTVKCKDIDDKKHDYYYESTMRILDYVGRLSMPAFNSFNLLEDEYIKTYPNAPALAKELWLKHYGNIHKPYNLIKNRCFRLLDEIDDEYIKHHRKTPPNWNP